jgi:hypothetical protein
MTRAAGADPGRAENASARPGVHARQRLLDHLVGMRLGPQGLDRVPGCPGQRRYLRFRSPLNDNLPYVRRRRCQRARVLTALSNI